MKRRLTRLINHLVYMDPISFVIVMLVSTALLGLIVFYTAPVFSAIWDWSSDTTASLVDWVF